MLRRRLSISSQSLFEKLRALEAERVIEAGIAPHGRSVEILHSRWDGRWLVGPAGAPGFVRGFWDRLRLERLDAAARWEVSLVYATPRQLGLHLVFTALAAAEWVAGGADSPARLLLVAGFLNLIPWFSSVLLFSDFCRELESHGSKSQ